MTPDAPSDPVAEARARADAALAALRQAQEEAEAAVRLAEEAARASARDTARSAAREPATRTEDLTGPLDAERIEAIRSGYTFDGPALELGALVNGDALPDVPVRIPLGMTNRHGLVAGATGTGKTRTLQLLAEQLSAHGVPVFAPDVKGDLSGVATPGTSSDRLAERTAGIGQRWEAAAFPTEFFSLGGHGRGVPIRATVAGFGPLLLAKVLGLNDTQESSLGLVFHWAELEGLPLLDLQDLRAVLAYLTSDEGKEELEGLGGLSKATAGVILRKLLAFADQGADAFFGEPELDTADLLRTTADGRGVISLLELPGVQDQPRLYSTFLMWLLADLYNDLPEVGDLDKPKLVFFFDEAHLLFADASKEFLASIVQTVRLIRSKGVGVFFVTQTPKDLPSDVLAQLGSRIQHQLRAFTPEDAKALRASVSTYPLSGYDLEEVLTILGTGEAIVTVMNERGAPSPVAWTRLRAPQGSMSPTPDEAVDAAVASSPLLARYGTALDRDSARELLTEKLESARREAEAAAARADAEEELRRQQEAMEEQRERQERRERADYERPAPRSRTSRRRTPRPQAERSPLEEILRSPVTKTILTGVVTGIFGTRRRRR
ncbi:helicase HerA-like domain-containing protein [Naasia sp. SYSU D00948]|uniref:helicase HerA-like domain-containing protein n=1 Tax=Naasia sp. SYSU D00948 TaxID=2817379 RepID=UPI001B30D9BC|nr:helicase HerA-like domain-containing protein [Naasia sp. SYSU D00948]